MGLVVHLCYVCLISVTYKKKKLLLSKMFDEPFELLVVTPINQLLLKAYRTLITIVNKFFNEYFLELFHV